MQIDDEMERHTDLLKEIEDNPTDINAIVAKRRRDFNGEFFRHLTVLQQTYDSLEDRDGNKLLILSLWSKYTYILLMKYAHFLVLDVVVCVSQLRVSSGMEILDLADSNVIVLIIPYT